MKRGLVVTFSPERRYYGLIPNGFDQNRSPKSKELAVPAQTQGDKLTGFLLKRCIEIFEANSIVKLQYCQFRSRERCWRPVLDCPV